MRDHTVGLSCSKAQFSQHCIDIKTKQKRDQAKKYFSYFDRPKSFINDGDDAEECSLCSFIFIFYFFFYGRRQQSDFCFAAETRIKQRAITKKTDNKTISRRLGMFLFFLDHPPLLAKKNETTTKARSISFTFFFYSVYLSRNSLPKELFSLGKNSVSPSRERPRNAGHLRRCQKENKQNSPAKKINKIK